MKKDWFVIQTLTGKEGKVKESIEARVKKEEMHEYIGTCLIPTEKVTETKDGKKRTINRKVFPGYVLVEMALYTGGEGAYTEPRKRVVVDRTWQFLRDTPGVIGFVGGDRPQPLKQSEIDAILLDKPSAGPAAERPKVTFSVEETVKITDGAFMGLTGPISMVDPDKGKLKVEVQVFGRKVPVDVEYWQVEKVALEETFEPLQ